MSGLDQHPGSGGWAGWLSEVTINTVSIMVHYVIFMVLFAVLEHC